MKDALVAAAAFTNPVDLTADGTASLEKALESSSDDPSIDAVIVCHRKWSPNRARASAIAQVAKKHDKPVVACLLGASTVSVSYGVSLVGELPSPERPPPLSITSVATPSGV